MKKILVRFLYWSGDVLQSIADRCDYFSYRRGHPVLLPPSMIARDVLGKIVIKVDADGCMAHDHKIVAVGRVLSVMKHSEVWPHAFRSLDSEQLYAKCEILPTRSDLANDVKFFYPALGDGCFYPSADHTYYLWVK